jgi:hypothetical protein
MKAKPQVQRPGALTKGGYELQLPASVCLPYRIYYWYYDFAH